MDKIKEFIANAVIFAGLVGVMCGVAAINVIHYIN